MYNNWDETIAIIPARMASTRLPGKPLKQISGKPMIAHVLDRVREAEIENAIVATDSEQVIDAVKSVDGQAIMTGEQHQSGSDRIFEALEKIDPTKKFLRVLNVQGDLPTISPHALTTCTALLDDPDVDIATLGTEIVDETERTDPNVVKLIGSQVAQSRLRALYFTRATAPYGEGPLFHHIGLYAYTRSALERFVSLPPSPLEIRERLEQLRALEAGMRIDAALVDTVPLGVDTPADLEQARELLSG